MKEKIRTIAGTIVGIIVIVMVLFVSIAATYRFFKDSGQESVEEPSARFVTVADEEIGLRSNIDGSSSSVDAKTCYLVDRETRVVYIWVNYTALTPLYNADGTLMTYQGELPQH